MISKFSVAIPESVNSGLLNHLLRDDRQEDLCFALWNPSEGLTRLTAVVQAPIFPQEGDREIHGNASFYGQFLERVIAEALQKECGVAFLHSHPCPGWQGMSDDDVNAESMLAPKISSATDLPLVGLTLGTDGAWSARFWIRRGPGEYERRWCETVRVVGERFAVTFADGLVPPPPTTKRQIRTVSAWGDHVQRTIARMHIGIVGAGSVGSIVGEALARTGVSTISLIDFDRVEPLNLDRLLHATALDAAVLIPKVKMLARGLRRSATASKFSVNEFQYSVSEEIGFKAALDCDVLFSCVDRPLPRSVLNLIAYAHLIPVADGGIRIEVSPVGELRRADWKMHIASPGRRCLECNEQYNPADVSLEREGFFDDPNYIKGLAEIPRDLRNENVFVFSANLASFEILQLLMMIIAPYGIADTGEQMYHFVPGLMDKPIFKTCLPNCTYVPITAKGDRSGYQVTGRHAIAEEKRRSQKLSWKYKVALSLRTLADKVEHSLALLF